MRPYALFSILIALVCYASGCASVFQRTMRFDMGDHRLIIASPESVNRHCLKRMRETNARLDDGREIKEGTVIAACVDYKMAGKPTLFISKKWSKCARHEACHKMKLGDLMYCHRQYPCLTVTTNELQ